MQDKGVACGGCHGTYSDYGINEAKGTSVSSYSVNLGIIGWGATLTPAGALTLAVGWLTASYVDTFSNAFSSFAEDKEAADIAAKATAESMRGYGVFGDDYDNSGFGGYGDIDGDTEGDGTDAGGTGATGVA